MAKTNDTKWQYVATGNPPVWPYSILFYYILFFLGVGRIRVQPNPSVHEAVSCASEEVGEFGPDVRLECASIPVAVVYFHSAVRRFLRLRFVVFFHAASFVGESLSASIARTAPQYVSHDATCRSWSPSSSPMRATQ